MKLKMHELVVIFYLANLSPIRYNQKKGGMIMYNTETIERLSRELERQQLLMNLNDCKTLEDFEKFRDELKERCEKYE